MLCKKTQLNSSLDFGCGVCVSLPSKRQAFAASKERILHQFGESGDGSLPSSSLIFDSSGNLYGTTDTGGALNGGTVFQLVPRSGGGWTENILYSFNTQNGDGWDPVSGVVMDGSGNLYGTTLYGGSHCSAGGCGAVFELTPGSRWRVDGKDNLQFLHSSPLQDGNYPYAGVIMDASASCTAQPNHGAEINNAGVVFELTLRWRMARKRSCNSFTGKDGGNRGAIWFSMRPAICMARLMSAAATGIGTGLSVDACQMGRG